MRATCWGFMLLVTMTVLAADEPARPTVLSVSRSHAAACQVFPTEHPEKPMTLRTEPILRRQQDTVGSSIGYTFLWVEESGRPAALCDVFYFRNQQETRDMLNEWHSFSNQPLTAKGPGIKDAERTFMASPGPGLEWKPIPKSEAPAKTLSQRRTQMGQLARRFQVEMIDKKQQRHELRLLTTPVFQYESKNSEEFLGGGIFAYCVETDPEVLILLEARVVDSSPTWMYAPVATSVDRQFLKLDDKEVWSANPPVFHPKSPHWIGFIKTVQIPVTTEAASKTS